MMHGDGLYLVFFTFVLIAFAGVWVWFVFKKIFRKGRTLIKEDEVFADKNFVDYLSEETTKGDEMIETLEKNEGKKEQGENEILKLAKKYNVEQGEVELILNLRSRRTIAEKESEYLKMIGEVERGIDMRKVAKKYRVGCGEIQLFLNLKNANHDAFLKKWK